MATMKEMANDTDSPVRDYLNPKSAITMGASAAMVLAFTTTLCSSFQFLPAAIVALSLSAMFGWAQVAYLTEKLGMKLFYAMVCTLIVFNAARGGNLAITDATGGTVTVPPAMINLSTNKAVSEIPSLIDILVPSAYAAPEKVKVDNNKYYFKGIDNDGNSVYTNAQGKVHIEPKAGNGSKFKSWEWKGK
jgi:hypothetical protein